MIRSMTGFGRGESSDGVRTAQAEIRSVNHRYGEISVKLPRRYAFAEDAARRVAKAGISRGKADISVSLFSEADEDAAVAVNTPLVTQYFKGLRDLQKSYDVTGDITLELLAGMPDVFMPTAAHVDEEAAIAVITAAVGAAVESLNEMRCAEGSKLAADIAARGAAIEKATYIVEEKSRGLPEAYAEKLRVRIAELLGKGGGAELAEERIALEAAVFADKSDITEEIVRLRSHIAQLQKFMDGDSGEPLGKKLDFLVQEMNREANTIGSKANDIEVTRVMLDIKGEVEKIREQVQNIE
ncbi:MAG: YicC family protein [Clostridiales Family XIII bacterium]|nr:YicC family protein [Clostridiales Family XIII bacterium]